MRGVGHRGRGGKNRAMRIYLDNCCLQRPVENRKALAACAEEAARRGVRIIQASEPAVSGYGFDGRDHAVSRVEVLQGTTARTDGSRVRTLVLWLTTRCNLRCAYCYRGEQREMAMPLEVIRSALQLTGGVGRPLHVQMAGGRTHPRS